jgi:LPXTG-site transpeptidase (sortase) family protein
LILLIGILFPFSGALATATQIVDMTWSTEDISVAGDDEGVVYSLPFSFPYFGRTITSINVNTNGLVELLELGESCIECSDYGTHGDDDHVGAMDAIFAANDDLITGIAIEAYSDRVEISWLGATYQDRDLEVFGINFKVIMSSDGSITWKFFDLDYVSYDYDLFSGVYANEEDAEYEIPGGTTSLNGEAVYAAFRFDPSGLSINSIAWGANDRSLPGDDDDDFEYTLPFNFPFFGRDIERINLNTNGLIELLENGETCYECSDFDTHGDGDHIGTMDAIFVANDDLITGAQIEAFSDRVELLWIGYTYSDYDYDNDLVIKVILYNDGSVVWKFFSMDWDTSDGYMYSGLYDNEGDREFEIPFPGGSYNLKGENIYTAYQFEVGPPQVLAISLTAKVLNPITQVTITFDEDMYDPAGDADPDDVTNPANYMLIAPGPNGSFSTATCAAGPQDDDLQLPTGPVTYNAGTYTATVVLNNGIPLPLGPYKLFVCGTTSITDLDGIPLDGGLADSIYDFTVVAAAAVDTGYAPNQITELPVQLENLAYTTTAMTLSIPDLGLEMPIVGVPLQDDGWDVSWLGNSAGWLEGTAYPTWEGNTVITGHVWDASGTQGVFINLRELRYGSQITIRSAGHIYTYEVRENFQVYASSINRIFEHEDFDWLTLFTCEGYSEWARGYVYRRVVKAVLVSVIPE